VLGSGRENESFCMIDGKDIGVFVGAGSLMREREREINKSYSLPRTSAIRLKIAWWFSSTRFHHKPQRTTSEIAKKSNIQIASIIHNLAAS